MASEKDCCVCGKPGNKTILCPHVYESGFESGIKRYTGKGEQREYLCFECAEFRHFEKQYRCVECTKDIDIEYIWTVKGCPEILREPKCFEFIKKELVVPEVANTEVLCMEPLPDHPTDLLMFTYDGRLWRLNLHTAAAALVGIYNTKQIPTSGTISISISRDHRYAALTCCLQQGVEGPSNGGLIIDIHTGAELMVLNCGNYHTEKADFPVAFIEYGGETLVIHATQWDQLDVTNPTTGECLTTRSIETDPHVKEMDSKNTLLTEWSGKLIVSPDQRRVATIGWVWHPVGVAYSWDARTWLDTNRWEPDFGKSKLKYAMWEYFWYSPFFWIDDQRLCIWGHEAFHTERDIPLPSAAIYDTHNGQLLKYFTGPTMDLFVFDTYLFSGMTSQDGITIWSIDSGALLFEQRGICVNAYHPGTKEFIEIKDSGVFHLHHWQAC